MAVACVWLTVVLSCSSANEPELTSIGLIEGAVNIQLRADGTCSVDSTSGSVPGEQFQRAWLQLTTKLDIGSLQRSEITASIREQIRTTGTVVAEDGALITTLSLGVGETYRQIEINGLAMLRQTYPGAAQLERFDAAREVLVMIARACTHEP